MPGDWGQYYTFEIYRSRDVNTPEDKKIFLTWKLDVLKRRIISLECCLIMNDLESAGKQIFTEEQRKILKKMVPNVSGILGKEGKSELLLLSSRYRAAIQVMEEMAQRKISKPPPRDHKYGWATPSSLESVT